MNCMKCGRELKGEQVFCAECLEGMEKYPVKPGTPVTLPGRKFLEEKKRAPKKRTPKPEERIQHLRTAVKWLILLLLVALLAFAAVGALLLYQLNH